MESIKKLEIKGISNEQREYFDSDDALYHYTKNSKALEHILKEMKLKFSKLSDFSDPKEKYLVKPYASLWELILSVAMNKISSEKRNHIYDEIKILEEKIRIVCFCNNTQIIEDINIKDINTNFWQIFNESDNRKYNFFDVLYFPQSGYEKDRMWEKYSENSSGVCFVFSKEKIIEQLESERYDYIHNNVNYSRFDIPSIKNEIYHDDLEKEAKVFLEKKLFTKSYDYRDESEFRIIIYNDTNEEFFLSIKNSLKVILFGVNYNDIYNQLYFDLIDNEFGNNNQILLLKFILGDDYPYYYMKNLRSNENSSKIILQEPEIN